MSLTFARKGWKSPSPEEAPPKWKPHSMKVTGLQVLGNSYAKLPPSIRILVNLEQLKSYPVSKRPTHGIGELKGMNKLKGELVISCMENVGSVETAIIADMKNKKHINKLAFTWSSS